MNFVDYFIEQLKNLVLMKKLEYFCEYLKVAKNLFFVKHPYHVKIFGNIVEKELCELCQQKYPK